MRKVGAASCAQDPLGAGQYLFTCVRWLDPDDPQDAARLASGLKDFLHRHEHLSKTLCPVRLVNVLRIVIATWRGSTTRHPSPLHHRVDVSETACFLPTAFNWTSIQYSSGVMPLAEHAQPVALPFPASRSEDCCGQTCERLAAMAGPDRSDKSAAVSAGSAAACFAARPEQLLSFLPPPSYSSRAVLGADSDASGSPPYPLRDGDADMPADPSPSAAYEAFLDPLQDRGGGCVGWSDFLADPFPTTDDCTGWTDGGADEWAADLPPAGDAGAAWETFDALLPLILRGCT